MYAGLQTMGCTVHDLVTVRSEEHVSGQADPCREEVASLRRFPAPAETRAKEGLVGSVQRGSKCSGCMEFLKN